MNLPYPESKVIRSIGEVQFTFDKLIKWKNGLLTTHKEILFYKLTEGNLILSLSVDNDILSVVGFWSDSSNCGYISSPVSTSLYDLYSKGQCELIPPNKMNILNSSLFTSKKSEKVKDLEDYAKSLLSKMVTSTTHSNKNHEELAIKAIKLSCSFYQQFSDFEDLYNKMLEDKL